MSQPLNLLLVLTFLVILSVVIAIYVTLTLRKEGVVEDGAPMPRGKRRILTLYLVIFGSGLVFMLVSLTSLDFPATPIIPLPVEAPSPASRPTPSSATATATAAAPTPAPGATQAPATTPSPASVLPILLRAFPQVRGETTTTPKLALYGKNFSAQSKVRFNMQRVPSEYVADNLITVSMESEYLVGRGSIMVDVVDGEAVSNAISLPLEKPQVRLNIFFLYRPWVTREIQLLLLVIFAGALGSYLHAIMSLTEFIAGRKLVASWFWWYITRPFLGMAMGLIFYAVLRGGFLAGTPADANVVNPFGVLAIGALVGMFSDKAARKLGEIFDVVFRSEGARSDSLQGDLPVIAKVEPATIVAGGTEPVPVKITGEHLANVSKVRVNKVDRDADSANEKEISFTLNPEDIAQAGQLEIRAVNPDGVVSEVAIINVSEPTSTDATSPVIAALEPATIPAGGKEAVDVKMTGKRLAKVSIVRVNSDDRSPDSVNETEVSFKLKPEDLEQAGQLQITAVNPDGSTSPPAILKLSEPPPTGTSANTTAPPAETKTTDNQGG